MTDTAQSARDDALALSSENVGASAVMKPKRSSNPATLLRERLEALVPPSGRISDWDARWAELEAHLATEVAVEMVDGALAPVENPSTEEGAARPVLPGDYVIFTNRGGHYHERDQVKRAGIRPGDRLMVVDVLTSGFQTKYNFGPACGAHDVKMFERA